MSVTCTHSSYFSPCAWSRFWHSTVSDWNRVTQCNMCFYSHREAQMLPVLQCERLMQGGLLCRHDDRVDDEGIQREPL